MEMSIPAPSRDELALGSGSISCCTVFSTVTCSCSACVGLEIQGGRCAEGRGDMGEGQGVGARSRQRLVSSRLGGAAGSGDASSSGRATVCVGQNEQGGRRERAHETPRAKKGRIAKQTGDENHTEQRENERRKGEKKHSERRSTRTRVSPWVCWDHTFVARREWNVDGKSTGSGWSFDPCDRFSSDLRAFSLRVCVSEGAHGRRRGEGEGME